MNDSYEKHTSKNVTTQVIIPFLLLSTEQQMQYFEYFCTIIIHKYLYIPLLLLWNDTKEQIVKKIKLVEYKTRFN